MGVRKFVKEKLLILAVITAIIPESLRADSSPNAFEDLFSFQIFPDLKQSSYLGKFIKILDSAPESAGPREVINMPGWRKSDRETPNFGYGKNPIWVSLDVRNASAVREWTLESTFIGVRDLKVYVIKQGRILEEHLSGLNIPVFERPQLSRTFSFPFEVEPYQAVQFLIRYQSNFTRHVPLRLSRTETRVAREKYEDSFFGIFMGAVLGIGVVNLFLFLILGHGSLLAFTFFLVPFSLSLGTMYGFDQVLIWWKIPQLHPSGASIFNCFAMAGLCFFTRTFLEVDSWSKSIAKTLYALSWGLLILGFLSPFFLGSLWLQVLIIIMGLVALFCFSVGIAGLGFIPSFSYYHLIGVGGLVFGISFYLLRDLNLINHFSLGEAAPLAGGIFEMLVFSAGVAHRINDLRKERDIIAIKALQSDSELKIIQSRVDYQARMYSLAQQVAHDIRSPVSALGLVLKQAAGLADEDRNLLSQAIQRIRVIADGLSAQTKETKAFLEATEHKRFDITNPNFLIKATQPLPLAVLVNRIIHEKNLILPLDQLPAGFQIEWKITPEACKGVADVDPTDFQRLFSNILTNAIEASFVSNLKGQSSGQKVFVDLTLVSKQKWVELTIADLGRGLPPEIAKKVGRKGFSWGKDSLKESGTGLGVYHAQKFVKLWGGEFKFESKEGHGSKIVVQLPLSSNQKLFVSEIDAPKNLKLLVVDDEAVVHESWKQHLVEQKLPLTQTEFFLTPEEARDWFHKTKQGGAQKMENLLFLVDYEFKNSTIRGLDLIQELGIESQAILVTYRTEDKHLLNLCIDRKIRLLPKELLGFIPIKQDS